MDTTKEEQQEFFEEFKLPKRRVDRFRDRYITSKRLSVTMPIENLVLVCIIVIMVVVLSFSLGVERGRRLGTPEETITAKVVIPVDRPDETSVKEKPLLSGGPSEAPKYTIQVATYRQKTTVDKEIESLKKNGFFAFTIPSEGYLQVCVGKYNTLEEAKADLKNFKDKYRDCFVRSVGGE